MEYFPKLNVIFYAAASVQYFARPFLECGVRVLTCHRIMAVPVAEFTLSAILLGNKGALLSLRRYRTDSFQAGKLLPEKLFPGTSSTKVGILGAGSIGSLVIEMLKGHSVEVLVYDPYLSEERRAALGVRQCSLEEIFESCQTISNHIANLPQTVGSWTASCFPVCRITPASSTQAEAPRWWKRI